MNDLLKEWVEKADGDHITSLREYRARNYPNYDAACFHAQQCIEKYLKAVLQQNGISFSKIHDLELLLDQCLAVHPLWEPMREDMQLLTQYAVLFRYPGETADKDEAKQAVQSMMQLRSEIRQTVGFGEE